MACIMPATLYHSSIPPELSDLPRAPLRIGTYFLSKSDQWCFFVGSFINVCDNEFWPLSRHSINSSHSLKTTIVWDVLPTKDEDWEWLTSFRSWNLSKVARKYQNNDIENGRTNDIFFRITKLSSENNFLLGAHERPFFFAIVKTATTEESFKTNWLQTVLQAADQFFDSFLNRKLNGSTILLLTTIWVQENQI